MNTNDREQEAKNADATPPTAAELIIHNVMNTGGVIKLLSNYEEAAQSFINRPQYHNPLDYMMNAALGLCGESGEFADIIKKHRFHGIPFTEEHRTKAKKELGDILWYIAEACIPLETSLSEIATLNIRKLADRHKGSKFNEVAAMNKDESKEGIEPQIPPPPVGSQAALDAQNNETSSKLQMRQGAMKHHKRLDEIVEQQLNARRFLKDNPNVTRSYSEILEGTVQRADCVWVPYGEYLRGTDPHGGSFFDAEKVLALNHRVEDFLCVLRPNVGATISGDI